MATSLRITECPHASTRDNQQRQLVDILFMAIKRMFFLKYRRSFGSMDDPLLGEVDDILSRLFSGSQPTTRRPSQGRNTVKRGPSTRHHSSGASASNGPVTPQMLAQSLNSLLVETDPARRRTCISVQGVGVCHGCSTKACGVHSSGGGGVVQWGRRPPQQRELVADRAPRPQ